MHIKNPSVLDYLSVWNSKKFSLCEETGKRSSQPDIGRKIQFSDGEIWWCMVGRNIGAEIYGKGEMFLRPVLILKRAGKNTFIGIPATTNTNTHNDSMFYGPYEIKNGEISIFRFDQVKTFDAVRLQEKMQEIGAEGLSEIRRKFCRYIST